MIYLFDTNIVSELYKLRTQRIHPTIKQWLSTIKPSESAISCVTLSEIKTGILLKARKDPEQADLLNQWFERQVLPAYKARTLAITSEIALIAAQLHIPNKMNINDVYIAATALQQGLILVTRNTQDFEKIEHLSLLNPFE